MNVYSSDIRIVGTIYVKAESEAEAKKLMKSWKGYGIEVDGNSICGLDYSDPAMPQISLSPMMTVGTATGPTDLAEEDVPPPAEE